LRVESSLIEDGSLAGLVLDGISGTVSGAIIRATPRVAMGSCGDYAGGILSYRSDLTVQSTRIEGTSGAAVASLTTAGRVSVESAALECDALGLVADEGAVAISLPTRNAVVCGCKGGEQACAAQTLVLRSPLTGAP
jgi:hypothetical protein